MYAGDGEQRAKRGRWGTLGKDYRCWCCPLGTYGRGLSLLGLDVAAGMFGLTNVDDGGRDDGRFGSWTTGGPTPHSGPGLCMPCMFAGIRGWGEWIAPIVDCVAD